MPAENNLRSFIALDAPSSRPCLDIKEVTLEIEEGNEEESKRVRPMRSSMVVFRLMCD